MPRKDPPPVVNWPEMRDRLEPGTPVTAMVTFHKDQGTLFMRVANYSCSADAFLPTNVVKEDRGQLEQFLGMTAVVTVTISKMIDRYACHGHKYAVLPQLEVSPLPLNPTRDELAQLDTGEQVVIEGNFVHYFTYTVEGRPSTGFRVETPSGNADIHTHYWVSSDSVSYTTYADGIIENLQRKEMMAGDRIRFTAFVTENHTLHGAYNDAYLLAPCQGRQREYNQLRGTVANLTDILELDAANKQYHATRLLFAQLRQFELTHGEQQTVQSVMSRLPQSERSIYLSDDTHRVAKLQAAFGMNVETLNKEQFLTFADEIVRGVRENPVDKEKRADQSYLFIYLLESPMFTHEESVSLLRTSLWARFGRLENRTEDHDDHWDDQWLLGETIRFMGWFDDSSLVDDIKQLVERCIDRGYFRKLDSGPTQSGRMHYALSSAIRTIEEWVHRKHAALVPSAEVEEWRARLIEKGAEYLVTDITNVLRLMNNK